MNPRQCVDISAMVTVPRFRTNPRVSKSIIARAMTRFWEKAPVRYAFAAIDTPFYEKLKQRGLPWIDLGRSTMYWGSMTTAGMIDTFSIPKGIQKAAIFYYRTKGFLSRK